MRCHRKDRRAASGLRERAAAFLVAILRATSDLRYARPCSSSDGPAAIDRDGRAGGERIGGEEQDRLGDVLRNYVGPSQPGPKAQASRASYRLAHRRNSCAASRTLAKCCRQSASISSRVTMRTTLGPLMIVPLRAPFRWQGAGAHALRWGDGTMRATPRGATRG
jgi:hypothetical protein